MSLTEEAQEAVGEEEKEASRCPTVSVSTEDTDTMLYQLEQSVTEMVSATHMTHFHNNILRIRHCQFCIRHTV